MAVVVALAIWSATGYAPAGPGPLRTRLARPHVSPVAVRMDEAEWVGGAALSAACKDPDTIFDIEKIMSILPHRYPFLLVDKVIAFEAGKRCVAIKKVTVNEQFFTGHFPNRPIMPGVLQVEAMAQVGGIVALQPPISDAGGGKGDFFFAGVDGIKWRRPVVPGDTLVMEVRAASDRPTKRRPMRKSLTRARMYSRTRAERRRWSSKPSRKGLGSSRWRVRRGLTVRLRLRASSRLRSSNPSELPAHNMTYMAASERRRPGSSW